MRAVAALVMAGALATAGPATADTSPLVKMFDANGNGCVSLDEYQTYMDQGFHRRDSNHDDTLDADELPPGSGGKAPLTLVAHHRHVARQFHRQDVDGDGCLDVDELKAPPRGDAPANAE